MNNVIGGKIEFEDGYSELANELNKQIFTVEELNSNSYFKTHGDATFELKSQIENGIKQKFNENSEILDKVEWENSDAYVLYAMLKKEFNYLEKFPTLKDNTFGGSEEKGREFIFDDEFIVFLKEENKEKPYFALKVDNIDVLVSEED